MRLLAAVTLAAAIALPAWAAQAPVLSGKFMQGGYAIGRAAPRAEILLNGEVVTRASADGYFVVGFDRDEGPKATLSTRDRDGQTNQSIDIAKVDYDVQRIDGLPQDTVTPMDPKLLARIKAEAARKAQGFASRIDGDGFKDGFIMPVKATRRSSRFGGQRILNGDPKRPHYGVDLAAPTGTPVVAPADGTVAFAETGLHFEGGLILIDHGQGLISQYLHLSKVDVKKGDRVRQGQRIGAVGMAGRATGPHLCWRLKWRTRYLDPSLMVGARRPG